MTTLMLERPRQRQQLEYGRRRASLEALVLKLERWLPAEEERLREARGLNLQQTDRERLWQEMLSLYERLCLALAPRR